MEQRVLFINLLIKLGVAAAVASALVRSVEFKKILFRERRPLKQRIYLILWIGIPLALGSWIRFNAKSFIAGDLTLETTILLGVLGGRFTGMVGGSLLALPALLHGEWATLPFMQRPGRHLVILSVRGFEYLPLDSKKSAAASSIRMADNVLCTNCCAALYADRAFTVSAA
jgi:hypothetical protein